MAKMTNQIIISGGIIGVCEGMLYAYKAGLDLTKTVELLGGGAASSFSLNVYGPRMIKRDFEPGFYVEHFVKDMGIAIEESRRMGLKLKGLELAIELYNYMMAEGLGKKGIQGLYLALEKLNNIQH
jgi:3-hydroxyisobutyrate dehydrogenase